MAFQRYSHGTSSFMNSRNTDNQRIGGMDKKVPGKTAAVPARQTRAALGNLSNRPTAPNIQKPGNLKVQKNHAELQKSKVTKQTQQTIEPVKEVIPEVYITQPPAPTIVEVAPVAAEIIVTQPDASSTTTSAAPEPPCDTMPMDMSIVSQDGEEEAFSKQMWKLNVQDIDADDANNPQLVSEYVNDIYEYMRELETRFSIRPHCLSNQTEINGRMRGILIDWLIQVHLRFQLLQETLFLTVCILDRYLQIENVARNKLQLVGVTSMWIAAKYEEMYAPEVADFVYITDNAYTSAEMRQMECNMLVALDFQLGRPLPIHFLRRNSKAGEVDATMHTLAKYLMELTVVDYDMVHLKPSEIAAAALCLSIKLIARASWTTTLMFYSRYTQDQLMPIIRKMAELVLNSGTGKLTAIKAKYQSSKFMRISKSPVLDSPLLQDLCDNLPLLSVANTA